jgi:hypothetical protein
MKALVLTSILSVSFGIVGCAAEPSDDAVGASDDALTAKLGADTALRCGAAGGTTIALVAGTGGKVALLSLSRAGDLFAVARSTGTLAASASRWSWKAPNASLDVGADLKGTWTRGAQTTAVACKMAPREAAAFRTARALADYADEIDGLAEAVLESSSDPKPTAYTVFAVETSRRASLSLGTIAKKSAGALPGSDDAASLLDENESSYGAMSAAYALGGGDDYGEWFQGASDGISLAGSVLPALGAGARAGFIARENVTALAPLVDSAKPSAVELTVGAWTFLLPDAFPKK